MKCSFCEKGELKKQKVSVDKFGSHVGFFNAEVCNACGEQVFDSAEACRIEKKIQELGMWGVPVPSRIYKVGGNFVVSIRKTVAVALGINKPANVRIIPQAGQKRFTVELA